MTWAAIAIVIATDALYLVLITSQPSPPPENTVTVPFVAVYLLVMAALLVLSLRPRAGLSAARSILRAAAGGGLLVLGVLAAFSIGLPILLSGGLAIVGAVRALPGRRRMASALFGVAAASVAVVVLVTGFEVTERLIICPAHGSVSGSGSGLITGPYYYDCVDGRLSFHSGTCNSSAIDASGKVTHPSC